MAEAGQVDLRSTSRRQQADEWLLVLVSQGLSPTLSRVAHHYVVAVPFEESERALAALSFFDLENISSPPEVPRVPASTWGWTVALGVTAAWLWFFVVTGDRHPDVAWFSRGSADAKLILGGELWRIVTALTLHAGIGHVVGNALFGTLFLGAVFRILGPGLGGLMVLLAGSAGNLATALFYGSFHSSVGASTAIFGAIGLLGGHEVVARRREGKRKPQVWAPAAAGLGLLAMIGMSERADLIAHLMGLVAGGVFGLGQAIALSRRPGVAGQWMLGGISVAVILSCWDAALR